MAETNGWIKLHRKLLDNPIIMKDADHLAIWMYLLLNATHAEYPALFKGEKITLQPGQLITGRKSIAEKLEISESKVTRVLNAFENEQQIEQLTSNKNRLISVVNWDIYQTTEQQIEQQVNNKRTTTEQQVNTNKNIKNNKNVKNERIYSDVPLLNDTILEFIKFRKQIKKPMTDHAVDLLLAKLNKMSSVVSEQVEILNRSIENGWSGIYPLSDYKGKQTRKEVVPKWYKGEQRDYDFEALERELDIASRPVMVEGNPELEAEAQALKKVLQESY